jgi:DNA-binding CsgD family transcriptional regulator
MMLNYKLNKSIFFILVLLITFIPSLAQRQNDSINFYKEKIANPQGVSIDTILQYFDIVYQISNIKEQIVLLKKKANFLSEAKMYSVAERFYIDALELSQKNNYREVEANIYHTLGFFYYDRLNKNKRAYKCFLSARDIYEELENHRDLTIIKTNIAVYLSESGNLEESGKLLNEALECYIEEKDTSGQVFVNINIANLLRTKKEYHKSEILLYKLLDSFKLAKIDKSLVYYNLAINAIENEDYTKALLSVNKSIEISKSLKDEIQLIDLFYLKATIKTHEKNYKQAINLYDKAIKTCREIKDYSFLEELLLKKIDVVLKSKKLEKIEPIVQQIKQTHDSVSKDEKEVSYKEIFLENEINKKERSIDYQKTLLINEKKQSRFLFLIIVLGVFLLVATIFSYIQSKKNNYKRILLIAQEAKINKIELEKKREIEQLKMDNLKREIEGKRKELLIDIAYATKRKASIETMINKMDELSGKSIISKDDIQKLIIIAKKKFDEIIKEENSRSSIAQINKEFYDNLLQEHPNLSYTELKILSYIRLNLDTKEIAQLQNVSVDAVRKTRYRVRKKLNLKPNQSLEKYILQYR